MIDSKCKLNLKPQQSLFVAGAALLAVALALQFLSGRTLPVETLPPAGNGSLKVEPAQDRPYSTIDILQNAGALQSQSASSLQWPATSDVIQPNAKTDQLSPADDP